MAARIAGVYLPRNPKASPLYGLVEDYFDEFERVYEERFAEKHGFWRPIIRKVADRFLDCGDLRHGFARIRCENPECRREFLLAFSCACRLTAIRPPIGTPVDSIVSDGVFLPDGSFQSLPPLDPQQLMLLFRHNLLQELLHLEKIYPATIEILNRFRHTGFSVYQSPPAFQCTARCVARMQVLDRPVAIGRNRHAVGENPVRMLNHNGTSSIHS